MRATRIRPGLPDHDAVVQVYPDADPPPEAHAFEFWRVPGRKQLIHDGKGLALVSHWPGCCAARAARRAWKTAWPYALCHSRPAPRPARAIARSRPSWTHWPWPRLHACGGGPFQATTAAVLELHTLQTLDATLAGASLREVAEGLFGADAVAADWHKDSGLRARVRRLVRRGDALMRGGYRRLAQLPPPLQRGDVLRPPVDRPLASRASLS